MVWRLVATLAAAGLALAAAVGLLAIVAQWDPYAPAGRRAGWVARWVLASLTLGFAAVVGAIWWWLGPWAFLLILVLPAVLAPLLALGLRDPRDPRRR